MTQKIARGLPMLRFFLFASCMGIALAAEWDCSTASGTFTRATDCTPSSIVNVRGTLKITGVLDANGVLPKIVGDGTNPLFVVEGGGELVLNSLNLTAEIEVRVDFFCREGSGGTCYDGSLAGYDASTNDDTNDSAYMSDLAGFESPGFTRDYAGWQNYCKSWGSNDGTFHGGSGACKTKLSLLNVEQALVADSKGAVQTCANAPTQCEDNGYTGKICTTRQNSDAGVICATNCTPGHRKTGAFNHTCAACPNNSYNPLWNQHECLSWSDCSSGQYISTNGTTASNRVCSSCAASDCSSCASTTANAFSCTAWTTCVPGQKIAANGTNSTDRVCQACTTGKFSAATNQNSCENWTACNATTEIESSAGSNASDRVCSPADSPSPAASSPSPADSPSPAASSPSPANSTEVPVMGAACRYGPERYLYGAMIVSAWFGL